MYGEGEIYNDSIKPLRVMKQALRKGYILLNLESIDMIPKVLYDIHSKEEIEDTMTIICVANQALVYLLVKSRLLKVINMWDNEHLLIFKRVEKGIEYYHTDVGINSVVEIVRREASNFVRESNITIMRFNIDGEFLGVRKERWVVVRGKDMLKLVSFIDNNMEIIIKNIMNTQPSYTMLTWNNKK